MHGRILVNGEINLISLVKTSYSSRIRVRILLRRHIYKRSSFIVFVKLKISFIKQWINNDISKTADFTSIQHFFSNAEIESTKLIR